MNINDMPMNETIKFSDHEFISVMMTRIEDEKMIVQYVNKTNGDEVARLGLWGNGNSELISIDYSYWTCTINGSPATNTDLSDLIDRKLGSVNINAEQRTINFLL
ncbi:hypothetical protein [Cellvibrio sp. KY-YJ-3]|uniref:hypothetical protein n=1 Tax=Cellvibrio sp. KY-YJ-3 TaxID=454662 RepID=UPI001245EA39|nr:hypothetical protein [Cellvibrio sp. KY-YJ-3]QEY12321.1 hypothetical protein D0B88_08675 [Cellvibrio sp. KY-YJ-3]